MTVPTLLGHLAKFGSLSMQAEVLCTQGLTHLLRTHSDARTAIATVISEHIGVDIDPSLTWVAEAQQADGARPDLEAGTTDRDRVPVVKIEAKLSASLLPEQLQSYVNDLLHRNSAEGVLLVLVPRLRIEEAVRVAAESFTLAGPGPWRPVVGRRIGVAVISWEELFASFEVGEDQRFRFELEQLQAMYRELSGNSIAPLASNEDLGRLGERETDFIKLVDQVTRELTAHQRVFPMQVERLEEVPYDESPEESPYDWQPKGYRRRYVSGPPGVADSYYCIGVRDSFAQWLTPIWMRFHKVTRHFAEIRRRIVASQLRSLDSGGHIWIPLDIPLDVSQEQMVEALVRQVEAVVQIAYADA